MTQFKMSRGTFDPLSIISRLNTVWRFRPHILFWGFGLVLYWGFVLIFYFEASASYFIWGFVLIFYLEASASYFILRLRPHIVFWGFILVLYWGFVLIFYFEASSAYYIEALSSYFILRLRPHYFILRLCSSVWGFGPHCSRSLFLCLYCLFDLFAVICV